MIDGDHRGLSRRHDGSTSESSDDGLVRGGADGVQLTWMDAKVGDRVITPRRGQPIEINALWYNALRACEELRYAAGASGCALRVGRRHVRRVDAALLERRARLVLRRPRRSGRQRPDLAPQPIVRRRAARQRARRRPGARDRRRLRVATVDVAGPAHARARRSEPIDGPTAAIKRRATQRIIKAPRGPGWSALHPRAPAGVQQCRARLGPS